MRNSHLLCILSFTFFWVFHIFVFKIFNLDKMAKNFSIHNILGIKEPEVVVLSSDSETEDNDAEVIKTESNPVSINNNGAQMVEVGIFMLDCSYFNCAFTVYSFASVHICPLLIFILFFDFLTKYFFYCTFYIFLNFSFISFVKFYHF